ncbi:MAG: radical SAM/SPASM domain-containing protein [bacterium]
MQHETKKYGFRENSEEFPLMCVIGLSYVCNSRCPHCPYTGSDIRSQYKDKLFMREDTFKIIADQCGEHNAWVRISGAGEPMLHKQAVELMEYAKDVGARVGLITNGSMFTPEKITRILQAEVDMVEISVDAGDAETYAVFREGLSWDKLLTDVKLLVKRRNQLQSGTKIIASAVNQQGIDIEKLVNFWSTLVDDVQVRKFLTWGGLSENKSADSSYYLDPEKQVPCPFIFERLNIDSDGRVILCGFDIEGITNLGNIHQKSIKEIWHDKEFRYFRDMHLQNRGHEIEMCSQCTDWKYRSWKHNYWKIVKKAESKRRQSIGSK